MIQNVIPLVKAWLPIWNEYLVYLLAGSFIAVVGAMLHFIFRR